MSSLAIVVGSGVNMADQTSREAQRHRATPNRLANETSPYLLQHQWNPVDWYPWGEEAFEAARTQDKPIFLSVGYSTCYWCHVMERESFEDPAVAEVLNAYFIPVKVDREERPDVDDVYMTAVQIMTGQGGWPMSVWLHPDSLKPFFGGTYFPPDDYGQRPGFTSVLKGLHSAWMQRRDEVALASERLGEQVQKQMAAQPQFVPLQAGIVDTAVSQVQASYDPTHGGYGTAPKFPMPVHLDMLLEAGWDRAEIRESMKHTLDRMAIGGMYDQIAGGFHRYSTDEKWLVPHFEKMLYDNGMLASVYAESADRTGDAFHAAIAADILDYVLAEMVDDSGAFWSAQDAESNAREGESYLWVPEQVQEALEAKGLETEVELALRAYGLDGGTNFRDPHHPDAAPANVLFLSGRPEVIAAEANMDSVEFQQRIKAINKALKAVRDQRDQPATDDKILAGWNGLMIGGMADVGRLQDKQRFLDAARRAVDAIAQTMWSESTGLRRTARAGRVSTIDAFLEDYAFLIRGVLRLYRATGDSQDLAWAIDLMDQARTRFWDEQHGWYDAPANAPDLFVRGRSLYDGAIPCGTSVMLDNQRWLFELTGESRWLDEAEETLRPIAWTLNQAPRGSGQAIATLAQLQRVAPERFGGVEQAAEQGPVSVSAAAEHSAQGMSVVLTFDIAPPWHVVLPGQGSDELLPMRIESLTPEVHASVHWPEGTRFEFPTGTFVGLKDRATIQVHLTWIAEVNPSSVDLSITWQACNDSVCRQPETRRMRLIIPEESVHD
ncbi:MAG: DUF255 domain-containing protein [Phycisphaerales bacterium]|nr:DUF255 domain-containing protein [Phycisphaerales bacterium]